MPISSDQPKPLTEEEAVSALLALGWKLGYVHGHGDAEPASDDTHVTADLEKENVLIPPSALLTTPVQIEEYFGW